MSHRPPNKRLLAGFFFGPVLAFVLLMTACREQETGAQKAASAPAEAAPETPASPATGAPTPSAEPRTPAGSAEPSPTRVRGVDGQDDPNGPSWLPASYTIGDWVKHEPIRLARADRLAEFLPETQAAIFKYFRVEYAASCAYALHAGTRPLVAKVVALKAPSPEDAYGLMTCQSGLAEPIEAGGEARLERRADGTHLHCWQGEVYLHVWSDAGGSAATGQMNALLAQIAGRIPRTNLPEIAGFMPTDSAIAGRRWLLRHLSCLPQVDLGLAATFDADQVSDVLGLGGDALMCICCYEVPQGQRPNVVWLVQYPDEPTARRAHVKSMSTIAHAPDRFWESTNVLEPTGRCLIGTWTAEEESLQYMMPRIAQQLPS